MSSSRTVAITAVIALTTSCTRRSSTSPEIVAAPDQHAEGGDEVAAASSALQDAGTSDAGAVTIFDERKDVSAIEAAYKPRPDETARVTVHCGGKRSGRMYADVYQLDTHGKYSGDSPQFADTDNGAVPMLQSNGPNHGARLCSSPEGATFFRSPGEWLVAPTYVIPFLSADRAMLGGAHNTVVLKSHDSVSVTFSSDDINPYGESHYSPYISVFDHVHGQEMPAHVVMERCCVATSYSYSGAWLLGTPIRNHALDVHFRSIEPHITLAISPWIILRDRKITPSGPVPSMLLGGEIGTIHFLLADEPDGVVDVHFEVKGRFDVVP